jgi:hypothetical protein
MRAREELQSQVAELGGLVKSGERMLQLEQVWGARRRGRVRAWAWAGAGTVPTQQYLMPCTRGRGLAAPSSGMVNSCARAPASRIS